MGRISSSIGLITGTPIRDTVDQLINLSAIPRDRLTSRNEDLKKERTAVTDLTVMSISVQLSARAFSSATTFEQNAVRSSNADSLSATRSGKPKTGNYQVRTLQTASTQAYRSRTYSSATKAFGTSGTLTIRGGGYVDRSTSLIDLNGGRGVQAGSIRITDRSGSSALVDLTSATTVDDVLRAINESTGINVSASTDGDAIRLVDKTGQTVSNLKVEDVGGGSTAADLGLRNINVASDRASGADILRLSTATKLSSLRDGRGLGFDAGNDIRVTFRDGAALSLDFADFSRPESNAKGVTDSNLSNARLTFTAQQQGASGDGYSIRFIDDPSVTAGNETVQLLNSPTGPELVFSIDEGATTASDIVAALQTDAQAASLFTVTAEGDGSGLVTSTDSAFTQGGAGIGSVDDPDFGDLLRVLNDAAPGRLKAQLSASGDSIELIDLTSGAGSFTVSDVGSSQVATNLGITGSAVDGVISGQRLLSGLNTVSLSALNGGQGLGELSELDITLGSGQSATVDLSSVENLQDVINAINESGLAVEASIDRSGAGLQVRDLSGGNSAQFSITSDDDTAEKLGVGKSTNDGLIEGESLNLQFVSRATKLSDLNLGRGVGNGTFRITDSSGATGFISLSNQPIITVGDLAAEINNLDLGVTAAINETGDGIRLIDTANGGGNLLVEDVGGGTSARQLGLAGAATKQVANGQIVSSINGRQVDQFALSASETLAGLAERVRTQSRYVTAAVTTGPSGSATLNISSLRGGSAGRLSLQTTGVDLGFQQTSKGQDAVISIGGENGSAPTLLRSPDGVFVDAIDGITLTAKQVSDNPVTIEVTEDRTSIESSINRFVEQYNKLMDRVKELTFFDAATNEVGLMFGRGEALRIQSSLSRMLTSRINSGSSIRSAADVGLKLDSTGKLTLETSKFQAALAENPDGVKDFFTREIDGTGTRAGSKIKVGFAAKIDEAVESIAGARNGLLINRSLTLNDQIENNDRRIASMSVRLEAERERLTRQFITMESAIARVQSNQQYLSSITYLGSVNSN